MNNLPEELQERIHADIINASAVLLSTLSVMFSGEERKDLSRRVLAITEIIMGELPIVKSRSRSFDTFVEDYEKQCGEPLEEEKNKILGGKNEINE